MGEKPAYQVLIGTRDAISGVTALTFQINPDSVAPISFEEAQTISRLNCEGCIFNPKNQETGQSPFVSRCKTFNEGLITTINISTRHAKNYVIENAACHPTFIGRRPQKRKT